MDEATREKWRKVVAALEAAGKTNSHLYRRAATIASGKADPGGVFK